MDQTLRTLTRAAARTNDRETEMRLAAAQVRSGALMALTQVVFAPPKRSARDRCTRQRSLPRLYITREPEGGDLTPRVRAAVLTKVLDELLGVPFARARWTATAGCTCGCSPGYVLRGRGTENLGDTHVRVLIAGSQRAEPRNTGRFEPWRPVTPAPAPAAPASNPLLASADRTLPPTRLSLPPTPPRVAPAPAPTPPASATPAPLASHRGATPPVGTVLQKRDRRGQLRCEAVVVPEGVRFRGTVYGSLSAAALAAAAHLGLKTKAINGRVWWGVGRFERRTTRRPASNTAPAASVCVACGGTHGLLRCPDVGR